MPGLSDLALTSFWFSLLPPLASALLLLRGRGRPGIHAWLALPPLLLLAPAAASGALPDRPAVLVVALVLLLGAVVQRFSLRFLQGDRDQPRALALMALATSAITQAWLATDSRVLLAGWGVALWGLCALVGLARDWAAAQAAARLARQLLFAGWAALAAVLLTLGLASGDWRLPTAPPADLAPATADWLAALLLLAVLAPAAQWPLQRWLMSSLVAPTPVSALMHAGVVNAGGLLLLRFGWLPAATAWASPLLLLLAAASVLLGAGMARVQVDVKRRLAASTVAQMGLMLAQCALGAYAAALAHLVLHGLYKASLFLQAGSTVGPRATRPAPASPWQVGLAGGVLATLLLLVAGQRPGPADILSALLLGMALAQALLGLRRQLLHPLAGAWVAAAGFALVLAQAGLRAWLAPALPAITAPTLPWLLAASALLLAGAALLEWLPRHPHHPLARRTWLALVAAGEAAPAAQDPHPAHLVRRLGHGA